MPALEDRIPKLLQMMWLGLNVNTIAKNLKIEISDMPIYENYIKTTIQNAISEGAHELADITEKTKLPISAVAMAIFHYKIDVPASIMGSITTPPRVYKKQYSKQQLRIEDINRAISSGASSVAEIVEQSGVSMPTIYKYARDGKIDLPKRTEKGGKRTYLTSKGMTKLQRINAINHAISERVQSLEEFCNRANLKPERLLSFCKKNNLELPPNLTPYKYRPEIDALIENGASLPEMSKITKITRQAVDYYIINSGQYEEWRRKREEVLQAPKLEAEQKTQLYQSLVYILEARLSELSKKESWAIQKASQYIQSQKFIRYRPEQLVGLFERRERAENSGELLSLKELGEPFGMKYPSDVGRIFSEVGFEPMYGKRERYILTPKEKKEALKRSPALNMSSNDIGYFLEIPFYVVDNYFARRGVKHRSKIDRKEFGRYVLTYRLASQIYESQDAFFLTSNIPELLGTNRKIVDYAIENRHKIEPEIIQALRTLYASDNIHNPYKVKGKYVQTEPPKKTVVIYTERIRRNK